MKVIDLVNMKNQNKEMPKHIIINRMNYIYDNNRYGGAYIDEDNSLMNIDFTNNVLNIPVEIIEEEKDIEEITIRDNTIGFPNGEWTARNMDKAFAYKINELVREINKLKKEGVKNE